MRLVEAFQRARRLDVDGVAGLRFLNRVASYLEQPLKLVLGA